MEHISTVPTTAICDGEAGSEHPRIYLSVDPVQGVVCPYCSRHFGDLEAGTVVID